MGSLDFARDDGFFVMESLEQIRSRIEAAVPGAKVEMVANGSPSQQLSLLIDNDHAIEIARFLRFAPRFETLARTIARKVSEHATPVGSGTVARTKRIPIERRAESAVIATLAPAGYTAIVRGAGDTTGIALVEAYGLN